MTQKWVKQGLWAQTAWFKPQLGHFLAINAWFLMFKMVIHLIALLWKLKYSILSICLGEPAARIKCSACVSCSRGHSKTFRLQTGVWSHPTHCLCSEQIKFHTVANFSAYFKFFHFLAIFLYNLQCARTWATMTAPSDPWVPFCKTSTNNSNENENCNEY